MAAPKVSLRKIKSKNRTVYRLDFGVNGKRIREVVGSNKNDAEWFGLNVSVNSCSVRITLLEAFSKTLS